MTPVEMTIVAKTIGMLAALLIGFLAVRNGFRLYRDGAGRGRDHVVVSLGGFSARASTVGSAVMVTGIVWGYFAYLIHPELRQGPEYTEVTRFETPRGAVTAPVLVADIKPEQVETTQDPSVLRALFEHAARAWGKDAVKVDGEPATVDWSSIEVKGDVLTMPVEAGGEITLITYTTEISDAAVTFEPTDVSGEATP